MWSFPRVILDGCSRSVWVSGGSTEEWTVEIPHKLNVAIPFSWFMGWASIVIRPDGSWLTIVGSSGVVISGSFV